MSGSPNQPPTQPQLHQRTTASAAAATPPGMRPANVFVPPRSAAMPQPRPQQPHPQQLPPRPAASSPYSAAASPSPHSANSYAAAPSPRPMMPHQSPPPVAVHSQWQPQPQQPPAAAAPRWQPNAAAAAAAPMHSASQQPQQPQQRIGAGNQSAPVQPSAHSWSAAAAPAPQAHASHHQQQSSYPQFGSVTPNASVGMHQRVQSTGFPQPQQPPSQPRNPYAAASVLSPQHSISPPAVTVGSRAPSPWIPPMASPSPSPSPAPAVPYNQPSPFGGSQASTPYGTSPYASASASSGAGGQLRKRAMHGGLAGSDSADSTPGAGRTVYDFTEAAAASLRNASLYEPLGPVQRKSSLKNKGIGCCTWVAICVLLLLLTCFGVWLHNPFGLFTHGLFSSRPPRPPPVRSMYASFEENPEVVAALRAQGDLHEMAERKRAEDHKAQEQLQQQHQSTLHETHPSAPAAVVKPPAPNEREMRVGATPSGATPSAVATAVPPPSVPSPSVDPPSVAPPSVTPSSAVPPSAAPPAAAPPSDSVSPLPSDLPVAPAPAPAPAPVSQPPSKETLRTERKANLLRAVEDTEAHPLVEGRDVAEHAVLIGALDHELHTELSPRKRGATRPPNAASAARFQFTVLSPHTISLCLGEADNGRNVIVVGNSQARALYFQLLNTLLLARGMPLQPTTRKAQHNLCAPLQLRNHFRVHDLTAQTLDPSCPQVLPRLTYFFVSELYDPVLESIFASNSSLILLAGLGMVDVLDSSKVIAEAHSLALAQSKGGRAPAPNAILANQRPEWESLMEERRKDLGDLVRMHVAKGGQVVSLTLPPVCTSKLHRLHSTEPLEAQEQTNRGTRLTAELDKFNAAMRDIMLGAGASVFDLGSYVPSLYLFPAPRPAVDFCPLYDDALHAGVLLRKVWLNNLANLLCKSLRFEARDRIVGGSLSAEVERRAAQALAARGALPPRCWHHRRGDSFTKGELVELEDNNLVQILPVGAEEAKQAAAAAAAAANANVASMAPLTPTPYRPGAPAVPVVPPPRRMEFLNPSFSSSDAERCLSEQYLPALGGSPSEVGAPLSARHPIVFVGGAVVRALYFRFVNMALGANHTQLFDESPAGMNAACPAPPPEPQVPPYPGRGAVAPAVAADEKPLLSSCPVIHSLPVFGLVQFVWHTGPFLSERGLPLRVLETAPQAVVAMGSPTPGPQARPEAHRGGGMLAHAMRHHLQSGRQWIQLTIPPTCAAAAPQQAPDPRLPTQGGRGQHHAPQQLRASHDRNRVLQDLNRALDGVVVSSGGSVLDLASFLPPAEDADYRDARAPPGRQQQQPPQRPGQPPMRVASPPLPPPTSLCASAYADDQLPSLSVRTEMATALWSLLCGREIKKPFYFKKGDQVQLK